MTNNTHHFKQTHPIAVGNTLIGGENLTLIAGPCSIESSLQISTIAQAVKKGGATLLRGGAFKPRTAPHTYQGMGLEGLALLSKAKAETGLPIVSEIMDATLIQEYHDVDLLQVGARNMQNFTLLKALSKVNKPILLKRGFANTIEEFLMSAEYLLQGGNTQVILCDRGIRTFEPSVRNSLDITSIPILRSKTHLPILVDPSHAAGLDWLVPSLSSAAIAAGAHGLMIEVHHDPAAAFCDKDQAILPATFEKIAQFTTQFYQKGLSL